MPSSLSLYHSPPTVTASLDLLVPGIMAALRERGTTLDRLTARRERTVRIVDRGGGA